VSNLGGGIVGGPGVGLIHLIRHGRPEVTNVLLGSSDVPLASEELPPSELGVDYVVASPLRRARRTAELLFPGFEISIFPEFVERDLGKWEQKHWSEVEAGWPDLAAQANTDWFATTPPGGERWPDFAARVESRWRKLPRERTTAIVAHIGVNAVLANLATGRDLVSFQQDFLEVVSFVLSD
jgi:alpha-ribazole phosphatase